MIDLQDFEEEYREACGEKYREARERIERHIHTSKRGGVPSDRWIEGGRVGHVGLVSAEEAMLRAYDAQMKLIDLQTKMIASMYHDMIQRGAESTEAHKDPMR